MRVNKAGLTVAAAAAMLAAGGCTKKVGGQVVAVVDGQEITQSELNAELNGQAIPPTADRKAVMAQLLQQIVNRKLLVGRAKEQGLDKAPTYLAQIQRAQDATLINMLAANAGKTIPVPDAAAASKFMTDNPSLFAGRKRYQLDQIVFGANANPTLTAKLRAAKTMTEVDAALKELGIPFQRGNATLDSAAIPPAAAAQIAAMAPGYPFVVPQGGQVTVNVVQSSVPVPVPAAQAQPAAVELLRRQAVEQAVRKQLESARSKASITYAPGLAPRKGAGPAAGAAPGAS